MIPVPNPKKRQSGESHVASYEVIRETEEEIILRFISKKGAFQIVLKSECEGIRNVYRIVRGKIKRSDSGKEYGDDDTIIVQDIQDDIVFDVLEETEFYWTTGRRVFDMIHDESQMIMDNLDEIQKKDQYTREHTLRVNNLAKRLGLKLGMSGQDIVDLSLAALAHDVGKIAIDDAILNKPAKLTDLEYEIMKEHVIRSKELVEGRFNEKVYRTIIEHHERIDGSGYPVGLEGDEISYVPVF